MTELRTLKDSHSAPVAVRVQVPAPPLPADASLPTGLILDIARAIAAGIERDVSPLLSQDLRNVVQITSRSIERIHFDDFLKSLPPPRCLWPLGDDPAAAIYASPAITLCILARLLGGTETPGPPPARTLTALEERLLHPPLERFAAQLSGGLGIESADLSCTAESSRLFASTESLIAIEFDMTVATCTGTLTLTICERFIEKLIEDAASESIYKATSPPPALASSLIQIRALAATTTLTPEELRDLQAGDIITTTAKSGEKMTLEIGSGLTLAADVVQFRGRRALVRATLPDSEAPR